jgi:hypothetical protein
MGRDPRAWWYSTVWIFVCRQEYEKHTEGDLAGDDGCNDGGRPHA